MNDSTLSATDVEIIRHKSSIAEYVQVFGLFIVPVFIVPIICMVGPLGVLHLQVVDWVLGIFSG